MVTFPDPVRRFFAALDLTHLNPFTLIAGECVNSSIAKYDTLVIVSTVVFAIVCALNWLVFAIRRVMSASPAQKLKGFTQHMTIFLGLTYLFYPTLSLMHFEGFACANFDGGRERLLRADLSIDCRWVRSPPHIHS